MAKKFVYASLLILVILIVIFMWRNSCQQNKAKDIRRTPVYFSEKKLSQLVLKEDIPAIQKLINKKIDLNEKDEQKMPPFLYAAFVGNIEIMRILEHAGANIHVRRYGQNALQLAILNNHKEAVEYLISRGIDCKSKDYLEVFYDGGFVKELTNGEDVKLGDNIFHLLAVTGNCEIARLFTEYKDIIDERNNASKTPLMIAAEKGHVDYMNYLLSCGAIIDAIDNYGMTPLHCAVSQGQKESVNTLMAKGANLDTKNIAGETLLETAIKVNDKEIVDMLQRDKPRGSDTDIGKKKD